MDLAHIKQVYFLGIGGIGMSALARYFNMMGCQVRGYDKTHTPLTQQLMDEGITIHFTEQPEQITSEIDLVIYTPAIPSTHTEWEPIHALTAPKMKRAEVLGLIANQKTGLAIAGTHGKTTTSAMLAHVMKHGFGEVNAFVGGILNNYHNNFLYGKDSPFVVVEADEFDRSFLHLHPQVAVINSIDADHLDIYGEHKELVASFTAFAKQVNASGTLLVHESIVQHFDQLDVKVATFGTQTTSDYSAQNIHVANGQFVFDLHHPNGVETQVGLQLPGKHNVENAVAASAVGLISGLQTSQIKSAFAEFKGVKRRFEITTSSNGQVYIDDYAHHPTEIDSVYHAARELYPAKKLTAIFQPHLYSRTRDFMDEFAASLSQFNQVILLDIYPARELPIEGVTSSALMEKMNTSCDLLPKSEVTNWAATNQPEVLITIGAGDIDTLVSPLKEWVCQ